MGCCGSIAHRSQHRISSVAWSGVVDPSATVVITSALPARSRSAVPWSAAKFLTGLPPGELSVASTIFPFSPLQCVLLSSNSGKKNWGKNQSDTRTYARRVDPSALAFILSLHRHPYKCILFSSRLIYSNLVPVHPNAGAHCEAVEDELSYTLTLPESICMLHFSSGFLPLPCPLIV